MDYRKNVTVAGFGYQKNGDIFKQLKGFTVEVIKFIALKKKSDDVKLNYLYLRDKETDAVHWHSRAFSKRWTFP